MTYRQRVPTEVEDRLVELAQLFISCREAFFETADRFHWAPGPESAAERAASALPSPDPVLGHPRGESGHRLIAEVVQTYLLTAAGHLGGLASLYTNGEVIFSPPAVIRAVIENCAHAMWVLGENSGEPAEDRLARAYLEELLSAEESKKNAGRMRDKTHLSHVQAKEHYDALKSEILTRFPEATAATLGTRTLNGQSLIGPEDTVGWMYAVIEEQGGIIDKRTGQGFYGFLSNMTHPTLYPARQRREWVDHLSTGRRVAQLRVEVRFFESQARAALAAFFNALSYVTDYFGWPTKILDDLVKRIDATIPNFFR